MSTRPRVFLASLGALALAVVAAAACDDHTTATGACADRNVISLPVCPGEDAFSDEACQVFDDRTSTGQVTVNDLRAPTITAPTEGQVVPAATPFTFRWTAPMTWRWRSAPRRPQTFADELARWTTILPEAQAHCAPFTGRGYDLIVRSGGQVALRRQQSPTSWTPSAAEWARLRAAGASGSFELVVQTSSFSASQVNTGSGPFVQATPRRFTIGN